MNEKIGFFILSYFPNNALRQKRAEAHWRQLECIKEMCPGMPVFIVAQQWTTEDINKATSILGGDVTIQLHEKGIGAAQARNACLKWLYSTQLDYGILADDDALIYPYFEAKNFLDDIRREPERFYNEGLDVIYAINPRQVPFGEAVIRDHERLEKNYVFQRKSREWFHWTFIRNFKKAYDREFYQIETLHPEKGEGYDDMDMSFDLLRQGYGCYVNTSLILKVLNMDEEDSVCYSGDDKVEDYRKMSIKATREKFFKLKPDGKPDMDEFWGRVWWWNPNKKCPVIPSVDVAFQNDSAPRPQEIVIPIGRKREILADCSHKRKAEILEEIRSVKKKLW